MLGADASRRFHSRLDDYAAVRKEGSQPAGTKRIDIDRAKAASDHVGAAVDAGPYSKVEAA